MAGIYTSSHTGEAIDVAVSSRTEVIDRLDWAGLIPAEVDPNKIYILSDTNEMYRSNGSAWILLTNGVAETTVPEEPSLSGVKLAFLTSDPGSYQVGWMYFIYNGSTLEVSSIKYALNDQVTLTIK